MEFLFLTDWAWAESLLLFLCLGIFGLIYGHDLYLFVRRCIDIFVPKKTPPLSPIIETPPISEDGSDFDTVVSETPQEASTPESIETEEVIVDSPFLESPEIIEVPVSGEASTPVETRAEVETEAVRESPVIEAVQESTLEEVTSEEIPTQAVETVSEEEWIILSPVEPRPEQEVISDKIPESITDISVTWDSEGESGEEKTPEDIEHSYKGEEEGILSVDLVESPSTDTTPLESPSDTEDRIDEVWEAPWVDLEAQAEEIPEETTEPLPTSYIEEDYAIQKTETPQSVRPIPETTIKPLSKVSLENQEKIYQLVNTIKTLIARGQTLEARGLIIQGLALDKEHRDLNFILGSLFEQDRHFEKAELIYKDLATWYPNDLEILEKLGNVLIIQRRYSIAFEIYKKIIDIGGIAEAPLYIMTHLSSELWNQEEKYSLAKQYLKQWPNNPEILALLAQSEIALNLRQDAIKTLVKLKNLTPYNGEIMETIQKLMMEEEMAGNFGG